MTRKNDMQALRKLAEFLGEKPFEEASRTEVGKQLKEMKKEG